MEVTITLPERVAFETRGEAFEFDLAAFAEAHPDDLAAMVETAIRKTGIDSGSSAKAKADKDGTDVATATRELVESWIAARMKAGWTREPGNTVDSEIIAMLRPVVKEADPKAYKAADETERRRMIAKHFAKLPDNKRAAYERTAAKRVEVKERQAAELAALDVDLGDD